MTAAVSIVNENRKSGLINILALLVLALLIVFGIYSDTVLSMIEIWERSDTYAHCYFILPAVFYLLWTSEARVDIAPSPNMLLTLLILPLSFLWLLASLVDVAVITQFSVVSMVVVATVSLLGVTLSRRIMFPLGFLLLSVPVGEELVPVMIEFTADFTVGSLRALGLPVFREGTFFSLPTGRWSVVEACSGVRYLIASFTIGLLYAYLTYRSYWRRLLFILFSLIIPVIANGLRAVMIVLLGHYSDMTIATGVDHLIYGWLFFGVVIFLMFWIGNYWREDTTSTEVADQKNSLRPRSEAVMQVESIFSADQFSANLKRFALPVLLITASLVSGPLWLSWTDQQPGSESRQELVSSYSLDPTSIDLPEDYEFCTHCESRYRPTYQNGDSYQSISLRSLHGGSLITIHRVAYYSWSDKGELINSLNLMVSGEDANESKRLHQSALQMDGLPPMTREHITGMASFLVYHWETVNSHVINSDIEGKIIEAFYRLKGDHFQNQMIAVSIPFQVSPEKAEKTLSKFIASNSKVLGLTHD